MNEPVCGDCWRRDHLTFVQRLDPAYIRRGHRFLCPEHRGQREELLRQADYHHTPTREQAA